jgi:cytochrome c-type biogenesis protein CcmE
MGTDRGRAGEGDARVSRRIRYTLAMVGIGVAVVLLMVTAIRAASTYYYTLPQFRQLGPAAVGRFVKVNGTVGPDPRWDPLHEELDFTVLDGTGQGGPAVAPLTVRYHGPAPDTFAPGISVVVAGQLLPSGEFAARQVLVKCPSHYAAAAPGGA